MIKLHTNIYIQYNRTVIHVNKYIEHMEVIKLEYKL